MRNIFIILFCLISVSINAATYYVSPYTGNDSDSGLDTTNAWLTPSYAVTQAYAGDTVYFLSGTYSLTANLSFPRDGTSGDYICFFAYPNNSPVFDFTNHATSGTRIGLYLYQRDYIHFYGLEIKNVKEYSPDPTDLYTAVGIHCHTCTNLKFELINTHDHGGHGFNIYKSHNIYLINCDSHHNSNPLHSKPGETGDGYCIYNDAGQYTYLTGCRAWSNSDDGIDCGSAGTVTCDSCWMIDNGRLTYGDGNGFKFGLRPQTGVDTVTKIFHNCIAAYGNGAGFVSNDAGMERMSSEVYNCTSFKNYYGFIIYNTSSSNELELERYFKNNIIYDNTIAYTVASGAVYTHSNNSWDIPLNLQPSDFVSLDSTGLTGARQADGSLPVLNFLKLSSTSAAIDAGTDVGLDYNNAAPDLGAYEYPTFDEAVVPYLNTTYPTFSWSMGITSGGNMLDAGGGTISRKGICWSTDANPDINDNVVEGGVGTDDFISKIWALKPNTTYHVRAFATNEYGTGYGADVTFTTPIRSFGVKNKKVVKLNGKIVII